MGPSAPKTSPSQGLPTPPRKPRSSPAASQRTPPQPSSLSSPAPSPAKGAPLRLATPLILGSSLPCCMRGHSSPWRGVTCCLSTPLLPKAAAPPFYFNNHNFHPPFHTLPQEWTSKSIGSGRVPTLLFPLLLPTPQGAVIAAERKEKDATEAVVAL